MTSLSKNLEASLHRAVQYANVRHHEFATLEHLLLALVDDRDAAAVMRACSFVALTDAWMARDPERMRQKATHRASCYTSQHSDAARHASIILLYRTSPSDHAHLSIRNYG